MDSDDWENIEKSALWGLGHPWELSPREPVAGMEPLLRLWEYSPQGTYTAWAILSSSGGTDDLGRPAVREVVWNRRRDEQHREAAGRKRKRRTNERSTVHVRDARIYAEDLRSFVKAAGRLFVRESSPPDPEPKGVSYGIEGYRSLAYVRLEWRGPGPAEWAQAVRWVTRLREHLAAALKEREKSEG